MEEAGRKDGMTSEFLAGRAGPGESKLWVYHYG